MDDLDERIFLEGGLYDTAIILNLIQEAVQSSKTKMNEKTFCNRILGVQDIVIRLKQGRVPVRKMKTIHRDLTNYLNAQN